MSSSADNRHVTSSLSSPRRANRWRRVLTQFAVVVLVATGSNVIGAQPASAAADALSVTLFAQSYVTVGSNIAYTVTVKNLTNQPVTQVKVYADQPAGTTYVSGDVDLGDPGIEMLIPTLAPNATAKASFVLTADAAALGTHIDVSSAQIYSYELAGQPGSGAFFSGGVRTTIEAPGTLAAIYKNADNRPFDVTVDGYGFDNFGNPSSINFSDDLLAQDLFELFGPVACQSGTTADTCVLTGPAKKWMDAQILDLGLGRCDGLASTSLRLFDGLDYRGRGLPGDYQPGATSTNELALSPLLENYIAHYFQTQTLDPAYGTHITLDPAATVAKLIADFTATPPVDYTLAIYKLGFKDGHSITAYGVETVSATESRILVYDNNYPNLREYITVDTAANTWRYETAATPGNPPDVYEGTATSGTLSLVPLKQRDLGAGEYFDAPFAGSTTAADALAQDVGDPASDDIAIKYVGEGSMLVTNSDGLSSGDELVTGVPVDDIPGATLTYPTGGLGKNLPPAITVPFTGGETYYTVTVHGVTGETSTHGSLVIYGPGYTIGVDDIDLEPGETFAFSVTPDGNHIGYTSSVPSAIAPDMYIAYDPSNPEDASLIFTVSGVIVDAGERIYLDLDPVLQRVDFEDTSALGQSATVDMELIFPDGTDSHFVAPIELAVGNTTAFLDFGAWDGLKDPAIYIDDVLQNPGANHRLKLTASSSTFNPTPTANAPGGVNTVTATFENVTDVSLNDVYFRVADIGAGNVVLDAVGGPSGSGAEIQVPPAALGADGVISPNESFTVTFKVGLAKTAASTITLDANGTPNDWADVTPTPSYDALDTSYVLNLNATPLPMLAATGAQEQQLLSVGLLLVLLGAAALFAGRRRRFDLG